MNISLKQYKYERVQLSTKDVCIPEAPCYYFETGIRRAIRVVPMWTKWNKKQYGKDEFIYEFEVTCVYRSMECKIEKFKIPFSGIEELYYAEVKGNRDTSMAYFVQSWLGEEFNIRTKEQFYTDLTETVAELNVSGADSE